MRHIEIQVNGVAYPCSPTMGAMLRFKQQTGKEITEIDPGSFTDLCTYLWCCIVSASKRDGKEFKLSLMEFADSIAPEDMSEWSRLISEDTSEEGGKESEKKSS